MITRAKGQKKKCCGFMNIYDAYGYMFLAAAGVCVYTYSAHAHTLGSVCAHVCESGVERSKKISILMISIMSSCPNRTSFNITNFSQRLRVVRCGD